METPENNQTPVITVGEWFITLLIRAIPLVNIIMLFVWAFGSGNNPNKANWARAVLLWLVIGSVIAIIIFIVFGAALLGLHQKR